MLAILPNSPGAVHPGRGRDALLEKRNRLLRRLAGRGTIDGRELGLALLEPLPEAPRPLPEEAPPSAAAAGGGGRGARGRRYATTLDPSLHRLAGDVGGAPVTRSGRDGDPPRGRDP